ncbi:MAG: D-isomer specific 2-hydroxyacid dehydrogenase family protein [Acidimicrobiales bacterium]|jgi:phosphoglycerate dehydrogenase-like enzyme|nr:D-isomer specific 2-hydroxyacid dehydrogenase family protein [Acidimicrobiales bacterium]MDP6901375.1 D-isomer specific 2-hydroxyacid dehydrogenase family protein [Acidimicrobiales bacterium]HJL98175.1 D-isomer specific 2-hydroxyacid dehydrogenase family protein [Acidimicrobiales bacterium]
MVKVAVEPECWRRDSLVQAVEAGGGEVTDPDVAEALVWAEPARADLLPPMLDDNVNIEWVQLPYAGIEPFLEMLRSRPNLTWTCGKGVYAPPVAEHVLAMALAGLRGLSSYAQADSWSQPQGRNLFGANVTILGGGGITEHLIPLLQPFDCKITVVRNQLIPVQGATEVLASQDLHSVLPSSDLLVLALALTPETAGIISKTELALLPNHAWLINVARGGHVVTGDLVEALREGSIGGAALDVTDPEPLPDGHPLWSFDNCLITPHIGNTPEMGLPLLAQRVTDNVERRIAGSNLIGPVDVGLGY